MYLLDIDLSSNGLIIALVAGVALVIVIMLLKSPVLKTTVPTSAEEPPQDLSASFMEHINRGNAEAAQFRYDQALIHYQEALKIKHNEPSLHFKVGRIHLQQDNYKEAVLAFRTALGIHPEMVEAHYELARVFFNQKNLAVAHQELDQALTVKPDHEDTLKLKITLLDYEKRCEDALPYLQKLIGVTLYPIKYRTLKAEYLCRLNRHEEGVSEYLSLIKDDETNRLNYQGRIGQAYYEQQRYAQAIDYLKLVLQNHAAIQDEEYLAVVRSQLAASLCNEGVRHFQAGSYTEAIELYREALLYDDANADIHYNLGKALGRVKDFSGAVSHFEVAIAFNPQDVSSYFEIAVLHDEKGALKEAQAAYEKVLSLAPTHVEALFGLGTLFGVQGDIERAIDCLQRTVKLSPDFVDALYNLGVALERNQDNAQAMKMYKKVLQLQPDHEKAGSNLMHIQHVRR